jgi:hypothetical protein
MEMSEFYTFQFFPLVWNDLDKLICNKRQHFQGFGEYEVKWICTVQ